MAKISYDLTCPNGHAVTATLEQGPTVLTIEAGQGITFNAPCPTCSASPLKAPSGRYEQDASGRMVRVGDYDAKA